ncbi:MAG: right-handed parallel beta-helix repeat-containing protein [Phycisphaerales bacterium]|nr:right-handed parallel beta-helix repeat-containing protein [Phycisphaerales bacterium]
MPDLRLPALSRLAAAAAALGIAAATGAQNAVVYVDDDAPPGGDGKSWNTAFRDLQDAIQAAQSLGDAGVHIAQGTYRPDRGTGARAATFAMECPSVTSTLTVWFQGGFAGILAPNPDLRDPAAFVTALSGDLNGDDAPGFLNRADNSLHVVTMRQQSDHTISLKLDGLTIRGGNADTGPDVFGGGVLATGTLMDPPVLAIFACIIRDNEAVAGGGGIHATDGHIDLWRSTIEGNRAAGAGGGVSSQTIDGHGSRFLENTAASGGGLSVGGCWLDGSVIAGNRALGGSGGGVAALSTSVLTSCRITGNSAFQGGGGVSSGGFTELRHCTITNNTAATGGGFEFQFGWSPGLVDGCVLWNNTAQLGAQGYFQGPWGRLDVNRCDVLGGEGGVWAPPGRLSWHSTNIADNPSFVDIDGIDNNLATWQDNDEHLGFASPCIDRGGSPIGTPLERDLEQNDRVVNARGFCQPRPDLGAYEFQAIVQAPVIPRLYVNAAAPPGGNGLTWASAYRTLQEAIQTPGVREVWVARGTYTPGPASDDLLSHDVGCELTILGGFAGYETVPLQRNPETNPTVFSGQDAQRVFRLDGADVTIDGCTVTRGYVTEGPGGGLYSEDSALRVSNCRWVGNGVGDLGSMGPGGGAIRTRATDLTITDSVFDGNVSDEGAGVYVEGSKLSMLRCDFVNNSTTGSAGAVSIQNGFWAEEAGIEDCAFGGNRARYRAGAVLLAIGATAEIRGCLFVQNSVSGQHALGGALWAYHADVRSSMFLGNRAVGEPSESGEASGGAAYVQSYSTFANCYFSGNRAEEAGWVARGGAIAASGDAVLTNCTLASNWAYGAWQAKAEGGGVWFDNRGGQHSLTVSNSVLWNNWAGVGNPTEAMQIAASPACVAIDHSAVSGWSGVFGGEGNHGLDPRFIDPVGPDGQIGTLDDNPRLGAFSPCIDAGRNSALPTGTLKDVLGNQRRVDDPGVPNSGSGPGPIVDMGAVEVQVPSCYADCNTDGVLNLADFGCFQARFAFGILDADCNHDGLLNLADFGCFQTKFALGCP